MIDNFTGYSITLLILMGPLCSFFFRLIAGIVLLDSVKNLNICFDCDSFRTYSSLPCFGSAGESECKLYLSLADVIDGRHPLLF